jgi:hypothetical protein
VGGRLHLTRRKFVGLIVGTAGTAVLPRATRRCRTCGAPTDVHVIDCTRELGSKERARTVCFSCTPEASVIDKYWYGFPSVMHARKNNVKCSECGVGPGYIHVRGREFEYRLCDKCAPEAVNCRRWVRDLRG